MEKKSYIVGVDIGSSNVVVVVGTRNADGSLNIDGIASRSVAGGVTSGRIDNVRSVGAAIRGAKEELEEELGIRINEAYAGISGNFIRCASYTDHVFIKDSSRCITKEDVAALHERMRNVLADDGEQIMDRIPQNYVVDDGSETDDPVGAFGRKLSSTFLFILCSREQIERVKMAFHNAGLRLLDICVNPARVARGTALRRGARRGCGGYRHRRRNDRRLDSPRRQVALCRVGAYRSIDRRCRPPCLRNRQNQRRADEEEVRLGGGGYGVARHFGTYPDAGADEKGLLAGESGEDYRGSPERHCGVRVGRNPQREIRQQDSVRHSAYGRFGTARKHRRTFPPRDGRERAPRCGEVRYRRGVAAEDWHIRPLDRRGGTAVRSEHGFCEVTERVPVPTRPNVVAEEPSRVQKPVSPVRREQPENPTVVQPKPAVAHEEAKPADADSVEQERHDEPATVVRKATPTPPPVEDDDDDDFDSDNEKQGIVSKAARWFNKLLGDNKDNEYL